MKKFTNYLWLVMLLVQPSLLFAQRYAIKIYTINDGLPGMEVYNTYQDQFGYLWVGTSSGLSRFDGKQFVNFSLSDGLPSINVRRIYEDTRGRLWVGTNGGIVEFIDNKFTTFPTSDHKKILFVFAFEEINKGVTWALTDKGVYEFDDSCWKKIKLCPGFDNKPCRQIVKTKDGTLFVNYSSDIVCESPDGHWRNIASHKSGDVYFNVMSEADNHILVSTVKNIFEINGDSLKEIFSKKLEVANYFQYTIDSHNRLWIVGKKFITVSKPGEWQITTDSIQSNFSISGSIYEDRDHNIWICSYNGLIKITESLYSVIENKIISGIYNMIMLPGNKILFSSGAKSGLVLYSSGKMSIIPNPDQSGNKNYNSDPVDAYTFDDKGTLWLGSRFRKFYCFKNNRLEDQSSNLIPQNSEYIYSMLYSKKRHTFFICADSTLLWGMPGHFSVFIPRNTKEAIIKPTRIYELSNGIILLYIDQVGVFAIDSSNNLISLVKQTRIDGSNKGVEADVSFLEDTFADFWIAFPGLGLFEYELGANKFPVFNNHFTIQDGLQGNKIASLTQDRQGRIWVAGSLGVDILQKNKYGKWEIFNYIKNGDLNLSDDFGEKLGTDDHSNVWLSSPDKIIRFDTRNIILSKKPPVPVIEKITLPFRETAWTHLSDSLTSYFQIPVDPVLKYNQNSLEIFYDAVDLATLYSAPEFSYKLIPLDTSWSVPASTKSVSFAELPSGKYQFYIRTRDGASGWSEPATFAFTIKQAFWNRWWFRLLIIIIASSVIIMVFRRRIKKIQQDALIENQIRELEMKAMKAQMNPHFIYNALNSIQALVAANRKDEGINYIGSFSRLLRQVLDNSESNIISLDKELDTIKLYVQLEGLRLNMQLNFKIIIPENIIAEYEKIPPLILQPIVENALWHGLSYKEGLKEIIISISSDAGWLICDITDNGIGRAKAAALKSNSGFLHQSKGIEITRKRLFAYNETERIDPITFVDLYDNDQNASGTKVTVKIKRRFYPLPE